MTEERDHDFDLTAMARQYRDRREHSYRSKALKLFPPVCARCGRDFAGRTIRELTVHHKDHNHDNNPPDGSNWELLCLYCHEDQHSRNEVANATSERSNTEAPAEATYKPFAALDRLLKKPR